MDVCGHQALYLPPLDCTDCSDYEARIKALEDALANLGIDKILFTINEAVVCSAVVCESTLCGEISTESTAEEIVNALKEYEGNNIRLKSGDMELTVDAYTIVDEETSSYVIYFDMVDLNNNRIGQYVVTGDEDILTYQYVSM